MTFCGRVSVDDSTGTYCWTSGVVSLFCQELTPIVENNLIFSFAKKLLSVCCCGWGVKKVQTPVGKFNKFRK